MIQIRRLVLAVLGLALVSPAAAAGDSTVHWSGTFETRYRNYDAPVDDDTVTGFFDQYEFTRNKDADAPIEIALARATLDWLRAEETPLLQFRLRSPSSDLSVSGGTFQIAELFLNQRAELHARPDGVLVDVDYRRMRTDALRLYPQPSGVGGDLGSSFEDDTAPDDRFHVRRGWVGGEVRVRPGELLGEGDGPWAGFLSEGSLRAHYEERRGKRQWRALLAPIDLGAGQTALWRARTLRMEQEVKRHGGGLVLYPGGLFTLALDVDHERFQEHAPTTLLPPDDPGATRSFGFVPDTGRTTGTAKLHARLGSRAVLHGGLQVSSLDQENERTPLERSVMLQSNRVRFYSGHLATDVALAGPVSANAFVRFHQRRNRLPDEPGLFSRTDGTQVDPFLGRVRRIEAGAEVVLRGRGGARLAFGGRGLRTDRKLEFASPVNPVVTKRTTVIADASEHVELYVSGGARLGRRLNVSGELGGRNAPETGYIRELDDAAFGRLRASYAFPTSRPLVLSVFGRGETGKNRDFEQVGANDGPRDRDFDRTTYTLGATLTGSPADSVTWFVSGFHHRDAQEFDLIRSNFTRNLDPFDIVDFYRDSELDYRSDVTSLVLGGSWRCGERTDLGLSYAFTRSNTRFLDDTPTARTIDDASRIRNDIHRVELEVGHRLRDGVRVHAGYRFENFRDRTDVPSGLGSSAPPFNLSTRQHTVVLGVTLDDRLLR